MAMRMSKPMYSAKADVCVQARMFVWFSLHCQLSENGIHLWQQSGQEQKDQDGQS